VERGRRGASSVLRRGAREARARRRSIMVKERRPACVGMGYDNVGKQRVVDFLGVVRATGNNGS